MKIKSASKATHPFDMLRASIINYAWIVLENGHDDNYFEGTDFTHQPEVKIEFRMPAKKPLSPLGVGAGAVNRLAHPGRAAMDPLLPFICRPRCACGVFRVPAPPVDAPIFDRRETDGDPLECGHLKRKNRPQSLSGGFSYRFYLPNRGGIAEEITAAL